MAFKDHFSRIAADYQRFRPEYPAELFETIVRAAPGDQQVWDVGTGTGQAARVLARYFNQVLATDASEQQIQQAEGPDNIHFEALPAEQCELPDQSVDLITVAQAIHWFDFNAFYAECKRVLKPGGVLAIWTYSRVMLPEPLDPIMAEFYEECTGPYWPLERKWVDEGYRTLPFPFEELETPELSIEATWPLAQLMGYIETWSAAQKYFTTTGLRVSRILEERLKEANPPDPIPLKWPLHLRMGR